MAKLALKILHFNDVYNAPQNKDGEFGVARFVTALNEHNSAEKLTVFSGDVFSNSELAKHFKGEPLIEPFKAMNVDVACLGNNELDYGVKRMHELVTSSDTAWLMANYNMNDGDLLPGLQDYTVVEKDGHKIGFFGLASPDWSGKQSDELKSQIVYSDYLGTAEGILKILKEEH